MTKINKLLFLIFAAVFFIIIFLQLLQNKLPSKNMIVVLPSENAFDISIRDLDNLNEFFPTSYASIESASLFAGTKSVNVSLINTNYSYPWATGYTMLKGSFFGEDAYDSKLHFCVLNRSAAFLLFGSYNVVDSMVEINGSLYKVSGVINDATNDDKTDSPKVYVPNTKDAIQKIYCNATSNQDSTTNYVANKLKSIGLYGNNINILALNDLSLLNKSFFSYFIWSIAYAIIIYFFLNALKKSKYIFKSSKTYSKSNYIKEVISLISTKDKTTVVCFFILSALIIVCTPIFFVKTINIILLNKDLLTNLNLTINLKEVFAGYNPYTFYLVNSALILVELLILLKMLVTRNSPIPCD